MPSPTSPREVPEGRGPHLWVKVRRSGWGDWGLSFVGFLDRGSSTVGCYLTCRKEVQPGVDVYEDVERSLDELSGRTWPRLGTMGERRGASTDRVHANDAIPLPAGRGHDR